MMGAGRSGLSSCSSPCANAWRGVSAETLIGHAPILKVVAPDLGLISQAGKLTVVSACGALIT